MCIRDRWYDHVVSVRDAVEKAAEAETPADGTYTCDVTLEGGSGRATVERDVYKRQQIPSLSSVTIRCSKAVKASRTISIMALRMAGAASVSYTHLDVYKRQRYHRSESP